MAVSNSVVQWCDVLKPRYVDECTVLQEQGHQLRVTMVTTFMLRNKQMKHSTLNLDAVPRTQPRVDNACGTLTVTTVVEAMALLFVQ